MMNMTTALFVSAAVERNNGNEPDDSGSDKNDGFGLLLSFVKSLFANKLLEDERNPIYEFSSLPPPFFDHSTNSKYALYAPGFELWKQLGMVSK